MPDDTAATTEAVTETIRHAIRLHEKIGKLQASLRDSLEVAGNLAGEMGEWMDYATFYRLAQELRDLDIPGRGAFTGGKQLPPPPGTVIQRHRSHNEPPWPAHCPCVYVLIDALGEVIYIGKSKAVGQRITQHRSKPWAVAEVIVCESEQAALDLEGDLIFQHQPALNRAGRWERPGPPRGGDTFDIDAPSESGDAERFAEEWRSWLFDGVPAPLPPMRSMERSLKAWIFGHGMTLAEVIDLIPIALDRDGIALEDRWRYFCGVAWNHAKENT